MTYKRPEKTPWTYCPIKERQQKEAELVRSERRKRLFRDVKKEARK